jgi:protein TonB
VADRKSLIDELPPPKSRVGDWSLAFAAAFALHAAILVPFLMRFEERHAVAPGASAVMVNIIRADSEPKAARPVPEKPVEKEEPKVEKSEPSQPKPVVAAPLPKTVEKAPAMREPRPAESKPSQPASAPSASSQTSSAKGKLGGLAAAGMSEAGVGTATARASYLDKLESWLAAHKHYPRAARHLGLEGVAILRFTLGRDGSVLSHSIEKSSGSEILDREVEATLRRAAPLPPPPPNLKGDELNFRFPIRFRLND